MKRIAKIILYTLALFLLLPQLACKETGPGQPSLDLTVFSCGKADCILLQFDGHNVLIDTGENGDGDDIVKELVARNIKKLDLMLLTHHDKDHIGGADTILHNIPTDLVRMPDYTSDSKQYGQLIEAIAATATPVIEMSKDEAFSIGSADFSVWTSTVPYNGKSDNEQSLITKVLFDGKTLLFMGDAEEEWLKELCLGTKNLTCDVLKLPHHGVYDKNLAALLALTLPDYVLITDSVKNPAEQRTMDILNTFESKVFQTKDGSIVLRIEGGTVSVNQ